MTLNGEQLKFANFVITSALIRQYPDRTQDQIAHDVLSVTPETFSRWRNGRKKIGKASMVSISKALRSSAAEIAKAYNDLLEGKLNHLTAPNCLLASLENTQGLIEMSASAQSQPSATAKLHHKSLPPSAPVLQKINVNIDTLGRNEALGFLAGELVQASGATVDKLTQINLINAKFRRSKAMLGNFLGIESPAVSSVLFDYSDGTTRTKSDIERLVAAGIDIEAIRDYGTSAFSESANIFRETFPPTMLVILVAGDPIRRKLLIEILYEILEKQKLLSWIEIQENDAETQEEANQSNWMQAVSKVVAVMMPIFEAAKLADTELCLVVFLVDRVMSITDRAEKEHVWQWIADNIFELTSAQQIPIREDIDELSGELKSCDLLLAFAATKELSLLAEVIATNSRKEGQIAVLLLETLRMAAKEKSRLSTEERVELVATLRTITQIRSGVISPRDGITFFRKVQNALPLNASHEASICMYQISYFSFQLNDLEMSRNSVLKSLDYDERNAPALCFRAVLETHDGNFAAATTLLKEAQASDNGYVFSHFYMGVLFEVNDDYDNAIASYIRCLIIAPNFYEAALNLTNSLLDAGLILDAARWVSAFLSKYSAPTIEFQTNIAVGLFEAGYSSHALRMLQSIYAKKASPLIAINIAKIYLGRAQIGMSKEWANKARLDSFAGEAERKEASRVIELAGKPFSIKKALAATPEPISQDEQIGDTLALLLSQEFQISEGTNNDIYQIVRRAINSKPRHAEKFAPKSVLANRNSEQRKENDRKLHEERKRYDKKIENGATEMAHVGRRRRRHLNKNRLFTDEIVLTILRV